MHIYNTYDFGHRQRFGITFELHENPKYYEGYCLHGSVCLWVFAKCIGDMAYGVSLSNEGWITVEDVLKRSASHSCSEEVFHADAELIVQTFESDMDNYINDIVKENCFGFVGTFDFWDAFRVELDLDIMQEYVIFHFEHANQARLIIATYDHTKEHGAYEFKSEHMLEVGELRAVFQEAFDWLCERYEQEVARENKSTQRCLFSKNVLCHENRHMESQTETQCRP